MNINVNREDLLKYLIVIVIIAVVLLTTIIVNYSKRYSSIQEIINENISATAWPEEVPIIKRNDINIEKYVAENNPDRISWTIRIKNGVSYAEFRDYLLELEEVGFKAVKELGSKSPRLLVSTLLINEEDFEIFWYGDLDDYRVEVYWRDLKGKVLTEDDYLEYVFTITLYKNVNKSVVISSGDAILSGDLISGDAVDTDLASGDFSGDIILNSGDTLSGDFMSGDLEIVESGEIIN